MAHEGVWKLVFFLRLLLFFYFCNTFSKRLGYSKSEHIWVSGLGVAQVAPAVFSATCVSVYEACVSCQA